MPEGGHPDSVANMEEKLDSGFLEKIRSVVWNGCIKGEVYDTY
jgi:hypothetical protein